MIDIAEGRKGSSFWESIPVLPKLWGKMLIKTVKADTKKKAKAPKVYQPSLNLVSPSIVNDFAKHQEELTKIMLKTDGFEHSTVITSPAARMITYSLEDANTIIVYHERRHLNQAKKIKSLINFPK
jgi:hypothetical protein